MAYVGVEGENFVSYKYQITVELVEVDATPAERILAPAELEAGTWCQMHNDLVNLLSEWVREAFR